MKFLPCQENTRLKFPEPEIRDFSLQKRRLAYNIKSDAATRQNRLPERVHLPSSSNIRRPKLRLGLKSIDPLAFNANLSANMASVGEMDSVFWAAQASRLQLDYSALDRSANLRQLRSQKQRIHFPETWKPTDANFVWQNPERTSPTDSHESSRLGAPVQNYRRFSARNDVVDSRLQPCILIATSKTQKCIRFSESRFNTTVPAT